MGRKRLSGPLDPLFKKLAIKRVEDFADLLGVTRNTVYRWQRETHEVSPYHRLQINMLFISRGLKPPYKAFDRMSRSTRQETGKRESA